MFREWGSEHRAHAFALIISAPAVVRYARSFDVVVYTVATLIRLAGWRSDGWHANREKGACVMLQFCLKVAIGLDSLNTKLHAPNERDLLNLVSWLAAFKAHLVFFASL